MKNFARLINLYEEPHRKYHNQLHIKFMYDILNYKFTHKYDAYFLPNGDVIYDQDIYDAIDFHDCIYNVKNKGPSNEVQSALYYIRHANKVNDRVVAAILATEHHFTDKEFDDPLTNLLLDLDIYPFALPYKDFVKINKKIDDEFLTEFSQEEVDKGRLDFLSDIIKNDSLRYRVLNNKEEPKERALNNVKRYLQDCYNVIL